MKNLSVRQKIPRAQGTLRKKVDLRNILVTSFLVLQPRNVSLGILMEQKALKIVNNCLNTNIYSYLETSGGQSYNLYITVVPFFNTSLN